MSPAAVLAAVMTATPPAIDPAKLPDTECVTNLPLAVNTQRASTTALSITLVAAPTANVELAVGEDANRDGTLSLEEAAFIFGYDCGVWFRADTQSGFVAEKPAPTAGRVRNTIKVPRLKWDSAWDTLRVVRRGLAAQGEAADIELVSDFGTRMIVR